MLVIRIVNYGFLDKILIFVNNPFNLQPKTARSSETAINFYVTFQRILPQQDILRHRECTERLKAILPMTDIKDRINCLESQAKVFHISTRDMAWRWKYDLTGEMAHSSLYIKYLAT